MSPAPKDTPPLRQRRKEARPQELLDAALALFVEKGFAATRSEEVAARAGVSKGTLYLYYPSKEELFKAVILEALGSKIAEGREELDKHQGPMAELLVWLLKEWWMRLGQTPAGGIMKIMLAEAGNFPDIASFYVEQVIDPSCDILAEVVRRGVASGEFRPVDPDTAVHVLIGPILHMVLHEYSIGACGLDLGPRKDPQAVIALHMELLFKGLLNRPDGSGSASGPA